MRNQNRITPTQARQLMQQRAILWDVRTPAEYAAGHIPSARNVPLDRLEEELPNLPSKAGQIMDAQNCFRCIGHKKNAHFYIEFRATPHNSRLAA